MEQLVITVLGDDRTGLVEALSGAITGNGGNWERGEMMELAGKFAGVLLVTVSPSKADALKADLSRIEASGLLKIEIASVSTNDARPGHKFRMNITGQDHSGIVHEISEALADSDVNIDGFSSEVVPAPMGGEMFVASAVLDSPITMSLHDLQNILEAVATDLIVDLEAHDTHVA